MTQIFLLLGAAGCGKTTFISNVVRNFGDKRSIAVVFNDDGDPEATDLPDDLGRFADITSMTAGCFGCTDSSAFLDRIRELKSRTPALDVILVEPVGFTDAQEMLDTLAELHVVPVVIALVDAAHHARNLRLGTTEGHVLAADCTLVTKIDDADPDFDALAWSKERCSDVRVFRPGDVFDTDTVESKAHAHHDCGHDHGHGASCDHHHDHGHSHSHDHGHHHEHVCTYHARLAPDVPVQAVQELVQGHPLVIRAKGLASGGRFSMVQGSWEISEAVDGVNFITFYTPPNDSVAGQQCLEALRPHYASGSQGLTGTDAAMKGEADVEMVKYQLDVCRRKPLTFSAGHPVPSPEWLEVLIMLRHRPGVPTELRFACEEVYVHHQLACARWYLDNPGRDREPAAVARIHDIAVGLGWFVSKNAGQLSPRVVQEAEHVPVADWLRLSLLSRTKISSNHEKELVIAEDVGVSAAWALRVGQTPGDLKSAWDHSVRLAEAAGDKMAVEAWNASWGTVCSA